MKRHPKLTLPVVTTLLIALGLPAARAAEDAPATAAEATYRLFAAIAANDFDRAVALTAPLKEPNPQSVREYYQGMAGQLKHGGVPQVIAHLELADTAVVVFRDSPARRRAVIDLDPAYLVRRDGRWLVLFEFTRFERPDLDLDEKALATLKQLEHWFEEQKPKLQKLLGVGT